MPDGRDLDPRTVIAEDRTRWILKRLIAYAYRKTSNVVAARDLAQQSVALVLGARGWHRWVFDPAKPWTVQQSLLKHLCNVARSTAKDERKSAAERREVPLVLPDPEKEEEREHADPAMNVEAMNLDEAEFRRQMRLAETVVERVDARSRALLELEQGDDDLDAKQQADRLGCTVTDVYLARDRIAYHRDKVLAEERERSKKEEPK